MFDQDLFPVANSGQSINNAGKTNSDLMYGEAIYDLFPMPLFSQFKWGNEVYDLYGDFEMLETEDLDSTIEDNITYNTIISLN